MRKDRLKKDNLSLLFLMAGVSLTRLLPEEEKRLRKSLNLLLLSQKPSGLLRQAPETGQAPDLT